MTSVWRLNALTPYGKLESHSTDNQSDSRMRAFSRFRCQPNLSERLAFVKTSVD